MERVSYVPFAADSDPNDRRSTCVGDTCWMHMRGWLYYPRGAVKHSKAIIYNHGHEQGRGEPCAIVEYFVPKGYVVFAPLRRGHYSNAPATIPENWRFINSTGLYIDDYQEQCLSSSCSGCAPWRGECTRDAVDIGYLQEQAAQEVSDQYDYLLGRPSIGANVFGRLVDPAHVALMGHSYGGSLVIIANALLFLPRNVVIAFSPAALSWNENDESSPWEDALSWHIELSTRPFYVLQARNEANGQSTKPTSVLPGVGMKSGKIAQGSLFPDAPWQPCDPTDEDCENEGKQAHGSFIVQNSQVKIWGPSVAEFINRYPYPPAEVGD